MNLTSFQTFSPRKRFRTLLTLSPPSSPQLITKEMALVFLSDPAPKIRYYTATFTKMKIDDDILDVGLRDRHSFSSLLEQECFKIPERKYDAVFLKFFRKEDHFKLFNQNKAGAIPLSILEALVKSPIKHHQIFAIQYLHPKTAEESALIEILTHSKHHSVRSAAYSKHYPDIISIEQLNLLLKDRSPYVRAVALSKKLNGHLNDKLCRSLFSDKNRIIHDSCWKYVLEYGQQLNDMSFFPNGFTRDEMALKDPSSYQKSVYPLYFTALHFDISKECFNYIKEDTFSTISSQKIKIFTALEAIRVLSTDVIEKIVTHPFYQPQDDVHQDLIKMFRSLISSGVERRHGKINSIIQLLESISLKQKFQTEKPNRTAL